MALQDLVVFNQTVAGVVIETLDQMINKFNAASGGAIVLSSQGFAGDHFSQSFFTAIHSAQRRVDRYASPNADVTPTPLVQAQQNGVKVAGGFGPVLFEPASFTWIMSNPAVAVRVISQNMAEAILADMLNSCIAAAVAAISNVATNKLDLSAESPANGISHFNLNRMHALLGDHSGLIAAHVMRGATFHKIIGQNIQNVNQLFQAGNVRVVDVLGRITVVTDAPSLLIDASPLFKEVVLGLTTGAVTAYDPGDIITNIDTTNGKQRIETTFQADYSFGLGMKGFSWDIGNGGKSPTTAEIATGTNWDKIATSHKHLAGAVLIGNAAYVGPA